MAPLRPLKITSAQIQERHHQGGRRPRYHRSPASPAQEEHAHRHADQRVPARDGAQRSQRHQAPRTPRTRPTRPTRRPANTAGTANPSGNQVPSFQFTGTAATPTSTPDLTLGTFTLSARCNGNQPGSRSPRRWPTGTSMVSRNGNPPTCVRVFALYQPATTPFTLKGRDRQRLQGRRSVTLDQPGRQRRDRRLQGPTPTRRLARPLATVSGIATEFVAAADSTDTSGRGFAPRPQSVRAMTCIRKWCLGVVALAPSLAQARLQVQPARVRSGHQPIQAVSHPPQPRHTPCSRARKPTPPLTTRIDLARGIGHHALAQAGRPSSREGVGRGPPNGVADEVYSSGAAQGGQRPRRSPASTHAAKAKRPRRSQVARGFPLRISLDNYRPAGVQNQAFTRRFKDQSGVVPKGGAAFGAAKPTA